MYQKILAVVDEAGWSKEPISKFVMTHLPNIFVLGEEGVQQFCQVFRKVRAE